MITQKVTTASGQATTENYAYDSLNRLTSESSLTSVSSVRSVANYSYDLSGNRTSKQVGDAGGTLATVNYALGLGNRLANWQVAETNPAARLDVAGFSSEAIGTDDRFGQLWVAAGSTNKPVVSGTNFWAYGVAVNAGTQQVVAAIRDVAGNVGRATNTVVVNVVTGADYGYNAAGCMTNISYSGTGFSKNLGLTWNGQYQLTALATNGVAVEQNGYDALGRRVWTSDGSTTNYYVYDGAQVVADVDASGTLIRSYTWGPGIDNLLAMMIYGGPGAPRTVYAIKDHLGSIHALVDAAGNIVEQYRYDAWGRTTVYDGAGKPLTQSAIGNRHGWQGREISWATGLYYFRARWYDPVTGRWLSNDPIGISGGLNQYVFCADNPVNFRDPQGRVWVQIAGALLGAGANYVHNFSAYVNGKISGWQYTQSVLFGAGAGFISTVVPGAGGVIVGGALAGVNDAYNQSLTAQSGINLNQSGRAALIGVGSGAVGWAGQWAMGKAGSFLIYDPNGGIGEIAGSAPYNFGDVGGAIGLTGGTLLGDNTLPSIFSPKPPKKCP
ncbi:MAG: hypothetical protein EPN23_11330 [Verrucomicrobia bacterium]|nr:MAG: hypothetical protein EPN23_11330 [Verrucomicrobiota bacterium]